MLFKGRSASEVWLQATETLVSQTQIQESRIGDTQELLHVMLTIQDPRQRWVAARDPGINPAFALVEIIWILNGRNDAEFLNYWNRQLPKYAGDGCCYHGAYGYRMRKGFGFDQIERAYHALLNNPDSRQVSLQIWNPQTDFPNNLGVPADRDIPCNMNAMLKIRNGRLEWMQTLRSNDVILGLPYNIIQFTSLQEVIAGWLKVDLGTYNHLSDSLHIYTKDIGAFQWKQDTQLPENTDRLNLAKEESDKAFAELEAALDILRRQLGTEVELFRLVESVALPVAYKNMLRVIAAEEARRNRWPDMMTHLIHEVTNPALQYAWAGWVERFTKGVH